MRVPLVITVVLLAAGCGVRPSGVITGLQAPTVEVPVSGFYLVSQGKATLVVRPDDTRSALDLLADGPSAGELSLGFTTEIPPGTKMTPVPQGVEVSTDVTALSAVAVDQIVCTATTPGSAAVTLVSTGKSRGPLTCP
jgi:spore germination protein GerM